MKAARLVTLFTAFVLVACAGPKAPLSIAIKEVPSDVVLGAARRAELAVAPIPPSALPINLTSIGVFESPVTERVLGVPASPEACPIADPLAAPALEAVNTIALPPAPSSYLFRNEGTFDVSGANAKKGSFPSLSQRHVKNLFKVTTPGSPEVRYRFDVEVALGALLTTTTYSLIPEQSTTPPSLDLTGGGDASATRAGLFIERVQSQFPDGSAEDFTPATPLLLLPFPISPGVNWNSAGSDVESGTAMAFSGVIGQKARIDACGVPLDAWTVRIDGRFGESEGPGMAISPSSQTSFIADYAFGTQYGGLSLMDTVEMDRTGPQGSIHQKNQGTINSEPSAPFQNPPSCGAPC